MKAPIIRTLFLVALGASLAGCSQRVPDADFSAAPVYRFLERVPYVHRDAPWDVLQPEAKHAAPFLRAGWHPAPATHDGAEGRWITRPEATLRFIAFDADGLTLELRLKPYSRWYWRQRCSLAVNGVHIGKQKLTSDAWQTLRFHVPPEALQPGANQAQLSFAYASRRRDQAAFVDRIALHDATPVPASPAAPAGDAWVQPPRSVVRWKMVVPRRGYLRFQADTTNAAARGRIRLLDGAATHNLFEGALTGRVGECSLAAFGGRRVELELTAPGTAPIPWSTLDVGGHIDPSDLNVYLLTIDSLRANAIGASATRRSASPFLDRFARNGVAFTRTWSTSNESLPSFATILTGRYPQSHGLIKNGRDLDAQQWSLSRLLGKADFQTAVYANFGILTWGRTTGKDFAKRRALPDTPPALDMSDTQKNVFAAGLNWATVLWKERQFLWLQSQFLHMDPVPAEYQQPFLEELEATYGAEAVRTAAEKMRDMGFRRVSNEYTGRDLELSDVELDYWRAQYRAAIYYSDAHLRAFWEGLKHCGLDAFALTVVASDHGTSLGEQHRLLHTGPPYHHLLHVPLLLRLPTHPASRGQRVDTLASTVDIAPTVLDLLGLKVPRRMQGRSLRPAIVQPGTATRNACYAMVGRTPTSHYYALRDSEWAYWNNFNGRSCLEHLAAEEEPAACMAERYPDKAEEMKKQLANWVRKTVDVSIGSSDELSDEVRAILIKAGYLENRE